MRTEESWRERSIRSRGGRWSGNVGLVGEAAIRVDPKDSELYETQEHVYWIKAFARFLERSMVRTVLQNGVDIGRWLGSGWAAGLREEERERRRRVRGKMSGGLGCKTKIFKFAVRGLLTVRDLSR